jgi:hypothetical protein
MVLKLKNKFHILEDVYQNAKGTLTEEAMQTVQLIETGQFVLTGR